MSNSSIIHHTTNAVAVGTPMISILFQAQTMAIVTGILGAIWYMILIGKEIRSWWKARK
jgi:hypothetical protein